MVDLYPEFLKRNVSLAAISTDDTADALKMVELTGAEFAVLSDENAEVAKD
ncbi:MAG: peroxiredoxin family protein, partial [Gemmatimonadetes bacterium]|nr:peroxiredoxin family protein [Gemmatimonadota bacterium]